MKSVLKYAQVVLTLTLVVMALMLLIDRSKVSKVRGQMDEYIKTNFSKFQRSTELMIRNDGLYIDNFMIFDVANNRETDLNSVLDNDSCALVLRISQYSCSSCTEYAVQKVNDFLKEKNKAKIMIWGEFDNSRDAKIFKDSHLVNDFYWVSELSLPIEDLSFPYLFVINRDRSASCVFTLERDGKALNDMYLELMSERFDWN